MATKKKGKQDAFAASRATAQHRLRGISRVAKKLEKKLQKPMVKRPPESQGSREEHENLKKFLDGRRPTIAGRHDAHLIVEYILSRQYIYASLWESLREALHRHYAQVVTVEQERGGAYLSLLSDRPRDFIPNDHAVIKINQAETKPGQDTWNLRANLDQEVSYWGICSACGRPFQYHATSRTLLVLTTCPNVLHGTGVKVVARALTLVLGYHS